MRVRNCAKRSEAAKAKQQLEKHASTKLEAAAICQAIGEPVGSATICDMTASHRTKKAIAATSHAAQRRTSGPSAAKRPRSMPQAPIAAPAKKQSRHCSGRPHRDENEPR